MPKNKNQHYIPRLLLKRFLTQTPRGKHTYRFQRGSDHCEEVGLSQAGAERYFYRDGIDPGRPDSLDEVLFATESRIDPIIGELCESHRVPASGSDQFGLMVRFIHDLYLRTPSMRAQLTSVGPIEMGNVLEDPFFARRRGQVEAELTLMQAGPSEQRYLAELFQVRTGYATSLSEETQKILHRNTAGYEHKAVTNQLARRSWRVLVAPAEGPYFVLGDEPVVVHDQTGRVRTGLKFPMSRVSVSLAPTVALQGCYSQIEQLVMPISALNVRKLNGVFAVSYTHLTLPTIYSV